MPISHREAVIADDRGVEDDPTERPIRRILIVDDDIVDCRNYCRLLERGHRHSYDVVVAHDGEEAMAAV
ncbi:MAG: hypothetical protein ACM3N5_04455, partial [Candidatus Eiseniibacteriota bacterium]